jgi:hypothetical protein
MKGMILFAVAMGFSITGVLTSSRALSSERYLIESTHKPEDCVAALDTMVEQDKKLLAKMEWGCLSGDHTGYVIVDAASEQDARDKLPETLRANAKVVKLNKFTPKEIASFHKK